jgi:hypothetical protein
MEASFLPPLSTSMSFVEVSCTVRLRTRGSSECPVEKEGWKVEGRTRERKKERKKERKRRKERREEGKRRRKGIEV